MGSLTEEQKQRFYVDNFTDLMGKALRSSASRGCESGR
jgi:hypothetical protein